MGKRIFAKRALSYMLLLLMFTHCSQKSKTYEEQILIKGGLIIQTGWNSVADEDIENGKYIVPGLIDGFAVINNQVYANAFLLSGVTSIIGVESARRGALFEKGIPSPEIFKLGQAGDTIQNKGQIAEGYDADILILDENPLDNIANLKKIHLLLLKGEVLDLNALYNITHK